MFTCAVRRLHPIYEYSSFAASVRQQPFFVASHCALWPIPFLCRIKIDICALLTYSWNLCSNLCDSIRLLLYAKSEFRFWCELLGEVCNWNMCTTTILLDQGINKYCISRLCFTDSLFTIFKVKLYWWHRSIQKKLNNIWDLFVVD